MVVDSSFSAIILLIMPETWDEAMEYLPLDRVLWNGLEYQRSQYPDSGTTGTSPDEEMSTDPNGDPIRTWMLAANFPDDTFIRPYYFVTSYFRLLAPDFDETNGGFLYNWTGPSNLQENAYYPIVDDQNSVENPTGTSVEYDQESGTTPAMPDDRCGVGFQQHNPGVRTIGICVVYTNLLNPETPRTYTAWIEFNHPLFFRRVVTASVWIKESYSPPEVSGGPTTYTYTNQDFTITPTDDCYVDAFELDYENNTIFLSGSIPEGSRYTAETVSFTFDVPEDIPAPTIYDPSYSYTIDEIFIKEVEAND